MFTLPVRGARAAFTIIELLVLIGILSLLFGLTLPALLRVLEVSRRHVCANHLREIGAAIASFRRGHNDEFPSGGEFHVFVEASLGEAMPRTLGFGGPHSHRDQTWSWAFQILPYLDNSELWQLRRGGPPLGPDAAADAEIKATPIPSYFCPSRREPQVHDLSGFAPPHYPKHGRCAALDYAGNAGAFTMLRGPPCSMDFTGIDSAYFFPGPHKILRNGMLVITRPFVAFNGETIPRDQPIRTSSVLDGVSNTLLIGEKRVNLAWRRGPSFGDSLGYAMGAGPDTLRTGALPPARDLVQGENSFLLGAGMNDRFGSSHPRSMNALFADGSVRQVSYAISDDPQACNLWNPILGWRFYPVLTDCNWRFENPPLPAPYLPNSSMLSLFQRLCHREDGRPADQTLLD